MMQILLFLILTFNLFKSCFCQSSLACWVGYYYNGTMHGGSIPCDNGMCVIVKGSYAGQSINIFSCKPSGECGGDISSLSGFNLNATCCDDSPNCNAINFTIPIQPSPVPSMGPPIVCNAGLYYKNNPLAAAGPKVCYGECSSFEILESNGIFSVATCAPSTMCKSLDLVNSCHLMPQSIISGCCCDTELCIDPETNKKPLPFITPSNSIKCFSGLQINGDTMIGAEVYCLGQCHSTYFIVNKNNYTIYDCDHFDTVCRLTHILPNTCGPETDGLNGCCCDSDYCNTSPNFTPPPIDPNPPLQFLPCFNGFSFNSRQNWAFGKVTQCMGDCISYTAPSLTIYGCSPISACEAMGAKDGSAINGDLNITCCSSPECTYQQQPSLKINLELIK